MGSKIAVISISFCVIAFIALVSSFFYINNKLSTQLSDTKERLANANTILDTQNKQILQNKLDLEQYQSAQKENEAKIEVRYIKIPQSNGTCESELNTIKESLQEFYKRGVK